MLVKASQALQAPKQFMDYVLLLLTWYRLLSTICGPSIALSHTQPPPDRSVPLTLLREGCSLASRLPTLLALRSTEVRCSPRKKATTSHT